MTWLTLAMLFITPLKLPFGRLWMFLPLALSIAVVYRATRARDPRRMVRSTAITFANIVLGMSLIAVAFYVVYEIVLRMV
ncbi:MAG: hypothetical protein IID33_08150 [Planctomycetes bacterium]|nr:hypothetical protein [Planctomycetota bacterium]